MAYGDRENRDGGYREPSLLSPLNQRYPILD
jgi:hypothetical protein